jgi:hypothetical protein
VVGSLAATCHLRLKEASDVASRSIEQHCMTNLSISDETPPSVAVPIEGGSLRNHVVMLPIHGVVAYTALVRSGDE